MSEDGHNKKLHKQSDPPKHHVITPKPKGNSNVKNRFEKINTEQVELVS